jgi:hypothetical protein
LDALLLIACPTVLLNCRESKIEKLADTLDLRDSGRAQQHLLADNPYSVRHTSGKKKKIEEDDLSENAPSIDFKKLAVRRMMEPVVRAFDSMQKLASTAAIEAFRKTIAGGLDVLVGSCTISKCSPPKGKGHTEEESTESPKKGKTSTLAQKICESVCETDSIHSMITSRGQFNIDVEIQRANQTQMGTRLVWYVSKGFSSQYIDVDNDVIPIPFLGFCLCMWWNKRPLVERVALGITGQRSSKNLQSGILAMNLYLGTLLSSIDKVLPKDQRLKQLKGRLKSEIVVFFGLVDSKSFSKSKFSSNKKNSISSLNGRIRSLYEWLCFWVAAPLMSKERVDKLIDPNVKSAYKLIDRDSAGKDFVQEESKILFETDKLRNSGVLSMVKLLNFEKPPTAEQFLEIIDQDWRFPVISELRKCIKNKKSLTIQESVIADYERAAERDIRIHANSENFDQEDDNDVVEVDSGVEELDDDVEEIAVKCENYEAFKKSANFTKEIKKRIEEPAQKRFLDNETLNDVIEDIFNKVSGDLRMPWQDVSNYVSSVYK